MKKEPRGIEKPLFTPFVKAFIVYTSIVETAFVLFSFFVLGRGLTVAQASTLALISMIIQEIVDAVIARNPKELILKQGFFANKQMNMGIIAVILVELLVFLTPIGKFISISTIETSIVIKTILINLLAFFFFEVAKPILRKVFED